jgi:tetratricopeptide (TPR) repeat protein
LSVGRYIVKLFWPNPLVIFYAYRDPIPVPAIIASLLGILVLTFFFYRERKNKKYLLTGWLWFLGTLVPVIGIVQVGSQAMADRYTYIPYIGLAIIVAWWLYDMLTGSKKHEVLYAALIVLLVATQAAWTKVQASYWDDPISLFEHSLKYEKGSPIILDNLGLSYRDKGQDDKAIECYREALATDPNFFAALGDLGNALYRKGDIEESIRCFKQAIEANPAEPNLYKAYANMGIAALSNKEFSEAVECFEKAKALNPDILIVYEDLGLALYQLGRTDEALAAYESGLVINPQDSNIYNNMGIIYWSKGERDKAHDCFEKAVQMNPGNQNAIINLRQFK